MGNYTKAYTIAFESESEVTSRSIIHFLERIEHMMSNNPVNVIRRINGKVMRIHAYEWNQMNHDYVVVPIGKLKEKNRPYGSDPDTQKLIDFPQDMYDVNSLAYHQGYNIALITTNQQGPNANDIEDYFNSFLDTDTDYKVRITPIVRNIALENIRDAQQARSITISLDVGRPLNDFLVDQVNEPMGILQHLKGLADCSGRTLESETFSLTLGLGRKKKATLDIGALVELLESINLNANCIKEITVNYRNAPDQKIDIAKLRDSNAILRITFPIVGVQLGAEFILNNMDELLRNERTKYYAQVYEHFRHTIEIGEDYEIRKEWDERPVV